MENKPAPPKRPMNATFLYLQEKREAYMKANPGKKITEATTFLCDEYKNLGEKDKKKYIDKFAADRKAYEKVNEYLM
jgi:HMG (high mobility group) box